MAVMAKDIGLTAHRLREIMDDRGCDQADLADAVGISQSAVSQLLNGITRNSRHLPKIADTLAINVSYLAGTSDERIDMFDENGDRITEDDLFRRGLGKPVAKLLQKIAKPDATARTVALPVILPNVADLKEMFEGLLAAVPAGSSREEAAQILAERLPSGFAAIGFAAPALDSAGTPVRGKAPRSRAKDHHAH